MLLYRIHSTCTTLTHQLVLLKMRLCLFQGTTATLLSEISLEEKRPQRPKRCASMEGTHNCLSSQYCLNSSDKLLAQYLSNDNNLIIIKHIVIIRSKQLL